MKKIFRLVAVLFILSLTCCLWACNDNHSGEKGDSIEGDSIIEEEYDGPAESVHELSPYIKLYVENSGSMFGYVSSSTEFKAAIGKIVHDKDFDFIDMGFNFINGDGKTASKSFNDKRVFEHSLSRAGMKVGDTKTSDLNEMLNTMLTNANDDTVVVFISDGIYDVGSNNYDALKALGDNTRETVRKTLRKNNAIQAVVIKMQSQFDGNYCYATKNDSKYYNDKRPYFIWIFGKGELLNKYFSDDKISKWPGYKNHARLQVTKNLSIPFKLSPENQKGSARIRGNNTLVGCSPRHNMFAFSIIVDYNNLAFSDEYLADVFNYNCDNNFSISQINKASKQVQTAAGVNEYKRPFVITFETGRKPMGTLSIKLNNKKSAWIDASNADDENVIDSDHTFGFSTLMEGIVGAYTDLSDNCSAEFTVIFKK